MANRQVNFTIGASISQLEKKLNAAQKKFRNFGYKMQRTGRKMTRNLSVPIGLAGVASLKLAADFEESMTRIQTLVGLSAESVDSMKQSVMALSNQTGRSSKELSEALFTVTSAGLRGENALSVLENSAKAAATGLGSTREIAKATTAVLQAYGKENISASQATDTLLKTVRAGNLEASELAPSLGRVIGIASTLGVSFEEVGANIATFTRLGVSSEEAVTGLRSAMNAFIKPGKQAKNTLEAAGLSMEGMRKRIQEDGLGAALQFLVKSFDGNLESLGKVIPNVRALSNVLGTAGAQGKEYAQIVDEIKNSTDGVDEAFKEVSKTTRQKFNVSLQKVKNEGIKLGTTLLPIATKIIGKVGDMADTFASFSDKTKENILIVAGALAVGGPLLTAIASASKNIASLIGGFKKLINFGKVLYTTVLPKLKAVLISVNNAAKANPYVVVAGALVTLGFVAYESYQNIKDLNEEIAKIDESSVKGKSLKELEERANNIRKQISRIQDLNKNSSSGFGGAGQLSNLKKLRKELDKTESAIEGLRPKIYKTAEQKLDSMGLGLNSLLEDDGPLIFRRKVETDVEPLEEENKTPEITPYFLGRNPISKKGISIVPDLSDDTADYSSNIEKMIAKTGMAKQKISEFGQKLSNEVAPVITNGLSDIGASFVEMSIKSAIAGNSFGGVMKSLLKSLADLAVRVGKIAIATGIAIEGIKKALQSLNPIAAIAAGGALIALGYGVKSALSKAATPSGGGGGTIAPPTPSGPSLSDRNAQRVYLSNISNQSQFSIQQAFERALSKAQLRAVGSDLQLVLNNSGYTNR